MCVRAADFSLREGHYRAPMLRIGSSCLKPLSCLRHNFVTDSLIKVDRLIEHRGPIIIEMPLRKIRLGPESMHVVPHRTLSIYFKAHADVGGSGSKPKATLGAVSIFCTLSSPLTSRYSMMAFASVITRVLAHHTPSLLTQVNQYNRISRALVSLSTSRTWN